MLVVGSDLLDHTFLGGNKLTTPMTANLHSPKNTKV